MGAVAEGDRMKAKAVNPQPSVLCSLPEGNPALAGWAQERRRWLSGELTC